MAIRTCPLCMTKVPPGTVVAYSNGFECPGCKAQLEVSTGSRLLATTVGLLAAALVWRLAQSLGGMLGWVLPLVYAFLVFSAVAAVFVMATADLRVSPATPVTEPAASPASRGHDNAPH